ncbi:ribonucleotide-diphosphate reductase subunit beta [Paucilactobacillus nenjiangensis]|uniref:ribonucleotide-diphosphate reductase subunit beta n=1 Tax=Paucilactobacillus nenjiangensis TaxID=1296540 RepID=UPI003BB7F386
MDYLYYKAINWDQIEDNFDKYTWEQLTSNFWLDIRVPIANDITAWQALPANEQTAISNMLASSSLINVFQSEVGTPSLRHDTRTQQEESVLNTITFMKSVHAKSCTTIFRELLTGDQSSAAFKWADNQDDLALAISQLTDVCQTGTDLQKKAMFILAETALVFGKYNDVLQNSQLINVNQMIENIMRGNAIFTAYLSYKFQLGFSDLTDNDQTELIDWINQRVQEFVAAEVELLEANAIDAAAAKNACYFGANHALSSLGLSTIFEVHPSLVIDEINERMINQQQFLQQVNAANPEADTEVMADDDYDF